MNAAEMADCIGFMDVFDPKGADRIRYAGRLAFHWSLSNGANSGQVQAACLAACELQCIVEAVRAERAGGIFIGVKE